MKYQRLKTEKELRESSRIPGGVDKKYGSGWRSIKGHWGPHMDVYLGTPLTEEEKALLATRQHFFRTDVSGCTWEFTPEMCVKGFKTTTSKGIKIIENGLHER